MCIGVVVEYAKPGKSDDSAYQTAMRVLGLEPKTYGLKGRKPPHKCLCVSYVHARFYVKNTLQNDSKFVADSPQSDN